MVSKATDMLVSELKKDLTERKSLMSKLELLTLRRLAQKYGLSIRQVARINSGEQRSNVK